MTLELDLMTDGKDIKTAHGTVVRSERRGPDRSDVWAFDIGVKFTSAMPELEPAIKALEERVKWLRDSPPKIEGA